MRIEDGCKYPRMSPKPTTPEPDSTPVVQPFQNPQNLRVNGPKSITITIFICVVFEFTTRRVLSSAGMALDVWGSIAIGINTITSFIKRVRINWSAASRILIGSATDVGPTPIVRNIQIPCIRRIPIGARGPTIRIIEHR